MKKGFWLCILAFAVCACNTNAEPTATQAAVIPIPSPAATVTPTADTPTEGLRKVFGDEFNDSSLDLDKWTTEYVWGRKNPPELQYYSPTAFVFNDGILRISATQKETEGMAFSSGIITTFDSFQFTYGYVEARIHVPAGRGLWPALWLLDYAGEANEIDIMEILGQKPSKVYMTLHYPDANGHSDDTGEGFTGPDFSTDFHTFAVDWNPKAVIWYVDGIERYRLIQNVPTEPMYLLANLAVGGDWPGSPDENTKFPAYYDIDYIRVFQSE